MYMDFLQSERGIPNYLTSRNNRVAPVDPGALPSVSAAYQHYISLGGTLTEPHVFGVDPLEGIGHLKQVRHDLFKEKFPTFDPVFIHC